MQLQDDQSEDKHGECQTHDFIVNSSSVVGTETCFCKFCGLACIRNSDGSGSESFIRSDDYNIQYNFMDNQFQISETWTKRHQDFRQLFSKINSSPRMKQHVVAKMEGIRRSLDMNRSTVLKAVVIFDMVIAEDPQLMEHDEEVLNLSMVIAAKADPHFPKPIKISDFLRVMFHDELSQMNPYLREQNLASVSNRMMLIEMRMMEAIKWNINPVTANNFLQLFLQRGVLTQSDLTKRMPQIIAYHCFKGSLPQADFPNALRFFELALTLGQFRILDCKLQTIMSQIQKLFADSLVKVVNELILNVVFFDRFYQEEPLMVALSVVAIARKQIGLRCWSSQLEQATRTGLRQFEPLMGVIRQFTVGSNSHGHYYDGIVRKAFANFDDFLVSFESQTALLFETGNAIFHFENPVFSTPFKLPPPLSQFTSPSSHPTDHSPTPIREFQLPHSSTPDLSQGPTESEPAIPTGKTDTLLTPSLNQKDDVEFSANQPSRQTQISRCFSFLSSKESLAGCFGEENTKEPTAKDVPLSSSIGVIDSKELKVSKRNARKRPSINATDIPLNENESLQNTRAAGVQSNANRNQKPPTRKSKNSKITQFFTRKTNSEFSISKNSENSKSAKHGKITKRKSLVVSKN